MFVRGQWCIPSCRTDRPRARPPQTFAQWHAGKGSAKQKEAELAAQDRKRRGVMTGREIFQQVRATDAIRGAAAALALARTAPTWLCPKLLKSSMG